MAPEISRLDSSASSPRVIGNLIVKLSRFRLNAEVTNYIKTNEIFLSSFFLKVTEVCTPIRLPAVKA